MMVFAQSSVAMHVASLNSMIRSMPFADNAGRFTKEVVIRGSRSWWIRTRCSSRERGSIEIRPLQIDFERP